MSSPSWTPEQLHCIHCHGGTLLVSAAAGSGKTTVLVERIVQRITDIAKPIDLDRLLVVTFTKAAAAQMRQRLSKVLSEQIAAHPDNLRLQRQQLLLPRADICTIDSFCANLVRENFHTLGISPQFKIADEQQLLLLQKDALQDTLLHFYEQNAPDFESLSAMLTNGKNDARLAAAVETIYHFIQSYPDPERWLCDTAAFYEQSETVANTVWGQLVLSQITQLLEQCERLYAVAIETAATDNVLVEKYTPSLQEDAAMVDHLKECAIKGQWDALFDGINSFSQARVGAAKGCEQEAAKIRINDLRAEVKSIFKKLLSYDCGTEKSCLADLKRSARYIRVLYDMVRYFTTVFSEKKRAANLLDFNDIEHFALSLLTVYDEQGQRIPTPLARELSERFDEILVDEYQDTNAVQDALFVALSRNEENLFLVGDVKQSIYAFRKAMPELFINRRNAYPPFDGNRYPGTITLGNNFRSRQSVTEAVNFVFRQIMSAELGGLTYDEREELVCSAVYPPTEQPEACNTACLIVDGTQYDKSELHKDCAEAQVIAEKLLALKNSFTVSDKEGTRALRYDDCCILLRNHKSHADAYRDTLLAYGIPAVSTTANGFFEAAEIRLALSLLRCIDNPLQDIALTSVMLSPLFGFSPDDLATLRIGHTNVPLYMAVCTARHHSNAFLAKRCTDFVDTLNHYRQLSALLTVDRLVSRLYEDLALPELLRARFGGDNRAENLRLLYEQCARFEQGGFRGLSVFLRHIDRLQEQGISLPGAAAHAENAVRIMSIHGSKGLEFPVVFLAGLANEFNRENTKADLLLHSKYGAGMNLRDPVTLARHVTLPRQGLMLTQVDDDRAEELRVLYVAMTRAREKLFLVMTLQNPDRRLGTLGAVLDNNPVLPTPVIRESSSMSDWLLSALLRHPSAQELRQRAGVSETVVLPSTEPIDIAFCAPGQAAVESPPQVIAEPPSDEIVRILLERMAYTYPHEALSRIPSKLAASESNSTSHTDFVAHARPSFMTASGLTPAERGTAMHAFMQFADYASAAMSVEDEIARLTAQQFLSTAQAESLDRKRLSAFFASELYSRMQGAAQLWREVPFTLSEPASIHDPSVTDADETVVIQGIADCVFEEDGGLVIVDYKTDHVKSADELRKRYTAQLSIYARALATVFNKPVRECYLYSFALGQTISL